MLRRYKYYKFELEVVGAKVCEFEIVLLLVEDSIRCCR